jgi:hypothetical protein
MAEEGHTDYFLRNVENSLWRQVKARAALEGKDIREVIIEALENYVKEGMEKLKKKK